MLIFGFRLYKKVQLESSVATELRYFTLGRGRKRHTCLGVYRQSSTLKCIKKRFPSGIAPDPAGELTTFH